MTAELKIEILPAGEHGPRRLDNSTTTQLQGIPFLTQSEFVRAKVKSWSMQVLTVSEMSGMLTHSFQTRFRSRRPRYHLHIMSLLESIGYQSRSRAGYEPLRHLPSYCGSILGSTKKKIWFMRALWGMRRRRQSCTYQINTDRETCPKG
jgi:hypothetical protein